MIGIIARRELEGLFVSPLAWALFAVVALVVAWLFLVQLQAYLELAPSFAALPGAPGVTDLVIAPTLANAALVMLLATPLLTMRALAEERRSGTLGLLRTAPVSSTQIVLGKYLGLVLFLALVEVIILAMPLSLYLGGGLDTGKLAAGALGLFLVLATFAAAGLYLSALTTQPAVAAVTTLGLLLLLWILEAASAARGEAGGLLSYLALLTHYRPLLKGLFDTTDVAYFALVILGFLGFTIRRLERERLQA